MIVEEVVVQPMDSPRADSVPTRPRMRVRTRMLEGWEVICEVVGVILLVIIKMLERERGERWGGVL